METVYLFRGKHPLYETMISHPPEGVLYIPKKGRSGVEEYSLYGPSYSVLRRASDGFFNALNIPRCVPILRSCDLVHSSRGFFVLGPHPYVIDMEHVSSFVGMRHKRLLSENARRLIRKGLLSNKCRRILPHCEAARRTISLVTDDRAVFDKTTVVYPAVDVGSRPGPRKDEANPHILFIGEYYWKGGREVLQACSRLASSQDFRLTFISIRVHPPEGVIEKARKIMNLTYVEGPLPRRELFERVYPSAAIFVMPTFLDTFGYVFLEAMAHKIPCVGTRHFAVPEIIENEVTGLLVSPHLTYFDDRGMGHPELPVEQMDSSKTTHQLTECLDRLLGSKGLRDRMGAAGYRAVSEGKFSISCRNSALKMVYEESLGS
jgi:glycosyltransferase involved in cell wall biosynthesis